MQDAKVITQDRLLVHDAEQIQGAPASPPAPKMTQKADSKSELWTVCEMGGIQILDSHDTHQGVKGDFNKSVKGDLNKSIDVKSIGNHFLIVQPGTWSDVRGHLKPPDSYAR